MQLFVACTRSFTHWLTGLASPVATHKFYDSLSAAHPPTDRRESCNRQLQQNCQLNWKRGRDRLGLCASVGGRAVSRRIAVMGRHLQRVRLRHWIHTSKHTRPRANGLFGVRARSSRSVGPRPLVPHSVDSAPSSSPLPCSIRPLLATAERLLYMMEAMLRANTELRKEAFVIGGSGAKGGKRDSITASQSEVP